MIHFQNFWIFRSTQGYIDRPRDRAYRAVARTAFEFEKKFYETDKLNYVVFSYFVAP